MKLYRDRLFQNGCPGYDTKLHWMVRPQFWRLEECQIPFLAITLKKKKAQKKINVIP